MLHVLHRLASGRLAGVPRTAQVADRPLAEVTDHLAGQGRAPAVRAVRVDRLTALGTFSQEPALEIGLVEKGGYAGHGQ